MAEEADWIEWNGGECPVHPTAHVEVKFRFSPKGVNARTRKWKRAGDLHWQHHNSGGDIVAYRIVEQSNG